MIRLSSDQVRAVVAARPDSVFALISDVTRTPEWSPEVANCTWIDGATQAAVGVRFTATNRRRWLTWTNSPTITELEPDRRLRFVRTERGGGTMAWTYHLAPAGQHTAVTLGYQVLQPVPVGLHLVLRLFFGVRDLRADLHTNMTTSLHRIDDILRGADNS